VFPALTPARRGLVEALREAGFDAATATTAIGVVPNPPDRPDLAPTEARRLLDHAVFLPVYPGVERETDRLLATVASAARDDR
jgi:hypothetical protein